MKVLKSGKELEGKKIVYCTIQHKAYIDNTIIITEDREILMYDCNYDFTYVIFNEEEIIRRVLDDEFVKSVLLRYHVIKKYEYATPLG